MKTSPDPITSPDGVWKGSNGIRQKITHYVYSVRLVCWEGKPLSVAQTYKRCVRDECVTDDLDEFAFIRSFHLCPSYFAQKMGNWDFYHTIPYYFEIFA